MFSKEVQVTEPGRPVCAPCHFLYSEGERVQEHDLVEKDERRVNAKSLLGVLSLGITKGTVINLIADGLTKRKLFRH
jgi:phosphocarrier protein